MRKKYLLGALAMTLTAGACLTGAVNSLAATSSPPIVIQPGPDGNYADNFNPFSSTADPGTDGLIYETMFYFDNVSGKQFDLLGTGYKFSNGNKTLTVTLHSGVKWSDSATFSSKDVVFTFNLLKQNPAADTNGVWQQLTSVAAKGSNQVVFNFKTANVPFAEQYVLGGTYIVPQHIWSSVGDPTKASVTKPVGTGPFVLNSFTPQLYTMVANKFYYLGVPKVPEVEYPAYSSNSSADLALAKGQITWGGIDIPDIQKAYVNQNPAHNHYYFPPSNVVELYANLKDPLLSQLPVREAISAAINRAKLSSEGETGYEKVAVPTSLILPNNNAYLDKSLPASAKAFTYSPSTAASILAKAGYKKDSNGILAKNGQELSFTLDVVAGWSDWDLDAELIEQELAQIGIKVSVNQMQFPDYYSAIMPAKGTQPTYQLAISWTNTGPTPYTEYYNMLDPNGNFNVSGFSNSTVTNALNNFSTTSNAAQQKNDIYTIEKYLTTQLPVIPLLDGATWYEYNDANYTGWPTAKNSWINPAPYTYQASAIVLDHLKPVQ